MPWPAHPTRAASVLAATWLLAGCVVVPRTADVYDPHCQTYVKQVVLEAEVIGAIGGCHNDGCAVMLASMGIIAAASAVVSGSIAVVGNIVYWAERRGQCPAGVPPPAAPPAPGPPQPVPGMVPAPRGA